MPHQNALDRLALARPGAGRRALKAWDAADELLADVAIARLEPGMKVLVMDDNFGALSLALADWQPDVVADSAILADALATNSAANPHLPPRQTSPTNWLAPPAPGYHAVVVRIPRQLDYLSFLLREANRLLLPGGLLIAGGMIKHLPDRSVAVFDELVTTEEVCPARKKARVVICRPGQGTTSDWPGLWRGYRLPGSQLLLQGLPAVFSRERLDLGTRLLLPRVETAAAVLAKGARVLDLGCGNGALGLTVLAGQPGAAVTFADVSSQALASARANVEGSFPDALAEFHHCDGVPAGAGLFDLILLNPPFHEGGVVGDHIALRLFRQAARHLAAGGQLLLVGNRHLGYHRTLGRYFGEVEQLAADRKFVVFAARHQRAGPS